MTTGPRVLVPVLDGDISQSTLDRARAALAVPGSRLVILHVSPEGMAVPAVWAPRASSRWRQLAAAVPVFVDAVAGDVAQVIAGEARRFGSDVVVLGRPRDGDAGWERDVATRVRQALPAGVTLLAERAPRAAKPKLPRTRRQEVTC